uniref:NADH-ubiquinone oxidoreductase chain 4L n=1 Tax=Fieberiella septentrionalis TaxID=1978376 RepID=A0A890CB80_9HEMI|nr:NADH dehydrogenase subunit 4L [Fieberiella septentrionalis]QRG29283.1 NADH dehydrogenase subunit 4L [Fieberiella septentrionalis]
MSLYLFMYMYITCLISLIFIRMHIFICLISLEFVVMTLLVMFSFFCMMYTTGFYLLIFLMVFFVCEGVLGLSVLVSMIRYYGNDYLNSFFMW